MLSLMARKLTSLSVFFPAYNEEANIKNLLLEFDVKCNKIYLQKGIINKGGDETIKLSLKTITWPKFTPSLTHASVTEPVAPFFS